MAVARAGAPALRAEDWPATSRLLPWGVALFVAVLWLLPVDAITLPVSLPVDSKLDRFLLAAMVVLWLTVLVGAPRAFRPQPVRSPITGAWLLWLLVMLLSLVFALGDVAASRDLAAGIKAFSLMLSYALLYWLVATTVREAEIPRLLDFSLVLAAIAGAFTVFQFRTGTNVFYDMADIVPGFQVGEAPFARENARAAINGPTGHGLAISTILGMFLPWAVLRLVDSPVTRHRVAYGLAAFLLVAGMIATQRKSALVVAIVGLLVVVAARPKEVLRLAPVGLLGGLSLQVLAPGALSGLRYQFSILTTGGSTTGRTEDYDAVTPDLLSEPLLGRGFGTFPADKYRFLDNEILGQLVTTGVVGIATYLLLLGSASFVLARAVRRQRAQSIVPLALLGGLASFLASNVLFDALAFRQVPYLLAVLLGFAAIVGNASRERKELIGSPVASEPPAAGTTHA